MKTHRLFLHGLGNVGRRFVRLLLERGDLLEERHGIRLLLIGAADSSGAALCPDGLDLRALLTLKEKEQGIAELPIFGVANQTGQCLLKHAEADLVLEATPTNLWNGEPGLGFVTEALRKGLHAVVASKGPLVVAFPELAALSDWGNTSLPSMRFSGAVGGCLPVVNLGRRDLAGCRIQRVEGVLNLSTGIYLARMEEGLALDAAIAEAQRAGLAEADPSLDVDGWDLAAKLCILAQAVLGQPTRLDGIARRGLRDLAPNEAATARQRGERILMIARATAGGDDDSFRLSVGPETIGPEHPFYALQIGASGFLCETDIQGRQVILNADQGPMGTAAAMLRDTLEICERRQYAVASTDQIVHNEGFSK
ncbi:MAG: hypothetical protein Q8O00_02395 [Holophaga sp.]|nr:hypothetical protein [Holophaga sp.]